jgi:hypothetical protein
MPGTAKFQRMLQAFRPPRLAGLDAASRKTAALK